MGGWSVACWLCAPRIDRVGGAVFASALALALALALDRGVVHRSMFSGNLVMAKPPHLQVWHSIESATWRSQLLHMLSGYFQVLGGKHRLQFCLGAKLHRLIIKDPVLALALVMWIVLVVLESLFLDAVCDDLVYPFCVPLELLHL